jgi:class 3 adenylate cyclase
MKPYPVPANEDERVVSLRSFRIMDTPPEIPYDEVGELAAQICACPVAYVSFIDEDRFWFKSKYGLPNDFVGCPREIAFCSVTICGQELIHAPDLSTDVRYKDFHFVVNEPHFRFYCGVPLVTREGYSIGSICVMDFQPRTLAVEQLESLKRLARQLMCQLEHRRQLIELAELNRTLDEARKAAAAEQGRAETILRSILPATIATELKEKGSVEPRFHPSTSILFTDFAGFTRFAEKSEPAVLVSFLDQVFSAFDEIAVANNLERLKTIGDAFMAVGGAPVSSRTHTLDVCVAALQMQRAIRLLNERRAKLRLSTLELRVGLHTGPVMAGIVGKNKFTYDIWGDAVNLSSRLESSSEPSKINVSGAVYAQVKNFFELTSRGAIGVKNKDPVEMFFLNRLRPEFSADATGETPNAAFLQQRTQLAGPTFSFPAMPPARA